MGAKEHHLTSPRLSNSSGHHFTPFFSTFNPMRPLSYPIPPSWKSLWEIGLLGAFGHKKTTHAGGYLDQINY